MNSSASSAAGFGRHCRLLVPGDYADAFAARKQMRGALFVLHYRHNNREGARLGLVIPKKQARKAVLRNAIKRQARESFRQRRTGLPAMDMILRLAQPVGKGTDGSLDKAGWKLEIESLLDRVCSKRTA